jgi:AcrR family transcriptional regulator
MPRVSARRREEYLQERREQILDAAVSVFGKKGFEGANVEDIAQAVGISKGTVYLYFKSKEDIFKAILGERSMLSKLADLTAVPSASLEETLTQLGKDYLQYMKEELPLVRLVLTDAQRFPTHAEQAYKGIVLKANKMLAKFLDEQAQAGKIRASENTFLAARAFMGLLIMYVFTQQLLGGQRFTPIKPEEWVRVAVHVFLDGVRD